jgi:hypothetical protein
MCELKFSLPVKGFCRYPAIEPRHLVGSRKDRLGRDRIPPAEDFASDHTQQDDQQQTGSNAKGGKESDSHDASVTLTSILPEYGHRINDIASTLQNLRELLSCRSDPTPHCMANSRQPGILRGYMGV